jgi:hypothetical protein
METFIRAGYFDGNWIDIGSLLGAVIYAVRESRLASPPQRIICRQTGVNIAHGIALFPLMILALSVFSSWLTHELLTTSKIILSAAGLVALLAILER